MEDFGRRYRELEVEPLLPELRAGGRGDPARELERALTTWARSTRRSPSGWSILSRTLVKRLPPRPDRPRTRASRDRERGRDRRRHARPVRPLRPERSVSAPPRQAAVILGTRASTLARPDGPGHRAADERVAGSRLRDARDRNRRRPDAGERRAASRDRRQGALHGGSGAGAPRRRDRPRGSLAQGLADRGRGRRRRRRGDTARGRAGLPDCARRQLAERPEGAVVGRAVPRAAQEGTSR